MLDAPHAAHLLASAGATGATVNQHRQGRTVARRFRSIVSVQHQHPAVIGGRALNELAGRVGRIGEHRQHEAASAAVRKRDRVGDVAVRHDRRHRPKRFAVVDRLSPPWIVGAQQHGRQKCAARNRRLGVGIAGDDPRSGSLELGDLFADVVALAGADQSAHACIFGPRVADLGLRQPFGERLLHCVEILCGSHGATDGGALLARLDRHLGRDFLDEQVELGRSGRRIRPEQRGVEAVLLGDEADRFASDSRMRLELERRVRRACEAHDVLAGQMVEQVTDAADDQLDRARRQDVGFDHDLERSFGEVGGRRGRLHDGGHAREQRRRQLLEHSPHREVERVDVHRRALQRGVDVLADERALLRQTFELAVEQNVRVGQLAAALGREGEKRSGAALNVDPAVLARGAGLIVELVQLFLARHDGEAQRFHHPRAVVEGQLAQRQTADFPRMPQHAAEIDSA